jgi:hypothetical protein
MIHLLCFDRPSFLDLFLETFKFSILVRLTVVVSLSMLLKQIHKFENNIDAEFFHLTVIFDNS